MHISESYNFLNFVLFSFSLRFPSEDCLTPSPTNTLKSIVLLGKSPLRPGRGGMPAMTMFWCLYLKTKTVVDGGTTCVIVSE